METIDATNNNNVSYDNTRTQRSTSLDDVRLQCEANEAGVKPSITKFTTPSAEDNIPKSENLECSSSIFTTKDDSNRPSKGDIGGNPGGVLITVTDETGVTRVEEGQGQNVGQENNAGQGQNQDVGERSESKDDDVTLDEEFFIVVATASFKATRENQLSFEAGDEIRVLDRSEADWYWAELDGNYGYVPANHVTEADGALWQDDEYFESYGILKLQLEMLNDSPRTEAYLKAIEKNSSYLEGKVVLDVGCGTGILSMFCVKFGKVKKVYAVEASNVAEHARMLIQENNMADRISVLSGRIEDVTIPEQVDVIVSEWMGTLLLFEYMLESVIKARDLYLKSKGLMWPSGAKIYMVPCNAQQLYSDTIDCWGNKYGLDFSILKDSAKEEFLATPFCEHVITTSDCLSDVQCFHQMDLRSVQIEDLECIHGEVDLCIFKDGVLHGFGSWFSVEFGGNDQLQEVVSLNTGPQHELTHWKQDLLMLDEPITVKEGNRISGGIWLVRNPRWRRHMTVTVDCSLVVDGCEDRKIYKHFKLWR